MMTRGLHLKAFFAGMLFVVGAIVAMEPAIAGPDTYGTAGCGLGSVIIGDSPGAIQLIASTLNGSTGTQTFGISSGTSNCDVRKQELTTIFIEVNRRALAKDVARGDGEALSSLAKLIGCGPQELGAELKRNFDMVFMESSSPAETSQSLFKVIQGNANLQACASKPMDS